MTGDRDVRDRCRTRIIDVDPGRIHLRGRPVQDPIGTTGLAQMIWLAVRGDDITGPRAALFAAARVTAVDHGPKAPPIAAARMAAPGDAGLQSAMATGLNVPGDGHGGAYEQAEALSHAVGKAGDGGLAAVPGDGRARHGKYLAGFGHRVRGHRVRGLVDPRAPGLRARVDDAAVSGTATGRHARTARASAGHRGASGAGAWRTHDNQQRRRDGGDPRGTRLPTATGARLFRPVAVGRHLAHASARIEQGGHNMGPTPPGNRWPREGAHGED